MVPVSCCWLEMVCRVTAAVVTEAARDGGLLGCRGTRVRAPHIAAPPAARASAARTPMRSRLTFARPSPARRRSSRRKRGGPGAMARPSRRWRENLRRSMLRLVLLASLLCLLGLAGIHARGDVHLHPAALRLRGDAVLVHALDVLLVLVQLLRAGRTGVCLTAVRLVLLAGLLRGLQLLLAGAALLAWRGYPDRAAVTVGRRLRVPAVLVHALGPP